MAVFIELLKILSLSTSVVLISLFKGNKDQNVFHKCTDGKGDVKC